MKMKENNQARSQSFCHNRLAIAVAGHSTTRRPAGQSDAASAALAVAARLFAALPFANLPVAKLPGARLPGARLRALLPGRTRQFRDSEPGTCESGTSSSGGG